MARESVPPPSDRSAGEPNAGDVRSAFDGGRASERPAPSERPGRERNGVEGGIAEVLKRLVEAGARNITPDNLKQLARDLKLPKEALSFAFSQIEETKSGLYRAVAGELRNFLERSSIADEFARALTKLTFEVKMQVRFVPSDGDTKTASPKVSTQVRVKKSETETPGSGSPLTSPDVNEPASESGPSS